MDGDYESELGGKMIIIFVFIVCVVFVALALGSVAPKSM